MKRMTIHEAAMEALKISERPMFVREIFNIIVEQDLYRFNAIDPENIVKVVVRRHCQGLEFPSAKPDKFFKILPDGRYWLKNIPVPGVTTKDNKVDVALRRELNESLNIISDLNAIHYKHLESFRKQVLHSLKKLAPTDFELFSKKLLEVYGFKDINVTPPTKDGGIDGFGRLKVGITYLDVGFQSKRWNNAPVSQKEIQSFRGCIQGKCEQGIYFTTSSYTKGAKEVSLQKGAVPIILIDGELIVDLMIDKEFGIDISILKVYSVDLDRIFSGVD